MAPGRDSGASRSDRRDRGSQAWRLGAGLDWAEVEAGGWGGGGGRRTGQPRQDWTPWAYLIATTIESGPTRGSTRVLEKPASRIQPAQSAPV